MHFKNTTHGSRNLLSIISLVILFLAVPIVATAQCPTNTVSCVGTTHMGDVEFYVSETSADPTHSVSFNRSSASYDLVDGRLYALVNVDDVFRHRSRVIAVDRFEIHNVLSAVIKVRLYLSLWWVADPSGRTAWAGGDAELTVGGRSVYAGSTWSFIDPFIELEVTAFEGDPFEVGYQTSAVAWGYYPSASMTCRLEFVDVPEGAEITSCNGYGSTLVPVDRTTWGAVKALYR